MTLEELTSTLRDRVGAGAGLNKAVLFDLGDDGVIRVDDSASPAVVDNQDAAADCRVILSKSDFEEILAGRLNPQMAFMSGKLRIEGDMSVALQLGSVLG